MTRDQVLPVTAAHRNEPGDRSATVGDLDLFALRDQGQVAAGMLAQLADADAVHVLHRSTTVRLSDALLATVDALHQQLPSCSGRCALLDRQAYGDGPPLFDEPDVA